jgi:hypothetical protein
MARPAPEKGESPPSQPSRVRWPEERRTRDERALDLFGDSLLPAELWPTLPEARDASPGEDDSRWMTLLREQRGKRR